MNLPNKLTIGRLGITGVFVAVMTLPEFPGRYLLGLILFIVASVTDFLDGYLARKHDLVTDFGKLMDPLADKILTGAVFILLTAEGIVPAWCTILIMAREFLVTGLRLLASSSGAVLAADSLGKWKTLLQIATACYFLALLAVDHPILQWASPLLMLPHVGSTLLGATVFITLLSGCSYFSKNKSLIKDY